MKNNIRYWLPLVGLYLAASLMYNLSFPILEGSDEPFHYGYIEQLRRGGGLPDPTQAHDNLAEYESSQAPLYYLTVAAVLHLVPGIPDWNGERTINPWFGGQPAENDNRNIWLHDLDSPQERFTGLARGVRIARLISMLYGLLAVLAAYWLTQEIIDGPPWLPVLSAAFVAFNPQFIQITAVTENDAAASAFVGLTLWRLARIIRRSPSDWWEYALAGVLAGLAAISKGSAAITIPLLGVGLLLSWWLHQKNLALKLTAWAGRGFVMFGMAALSGGWWYLRNWLLYTDPLRSSAYDGYPWMYNELKTLSELLPDVLRSLISYWADLGYSGDIRPSWVFYAGMGLITILALIGLARRIIDHKSKAHDEKTYLALLLLIASSIAMTFVMYIRLQQTFSFAWGRHLLPSVTAFGTLLAVGLYHLWTRRARLLGQAAAAFLIGYALYIPPLVLQPAYLPPRVAKLPPLTEQLNWQYGDVAKLIGYQVDSRVIQPGQDKYVTLCWQTQGKTDRDYAFALQFVGPGEQLVGARDSHHGLGRYPSSAWRVGDVFCDQVRVGITRDLAQAQFYQIVIAVYDPAMGEKLSVIGPRGNPAPTFAGWVKAPSQGYIPEQAIRFDAEIRFSDLITLQGYQFTDKRNLVLYWEALSKPPEDYTVFIHVVDESGRIVTQEDGPPRNGRYPTWAWDTGEIIEDYRQINIPADAQGPFRVLVGLYKRTTGERLLATNSGQSLPDNAVVLAVPKNLPEQ